MAKKPRKQAKPSARKQAAATGRAGLPALYWDACELAQQGKYEEARRLYAKLKQGRREPRLRALVANDLAALAALEGKNDDAMAGWRAALEAEPACLPAR